MCISLSDIQLMPCSGVEARRESHTSVGGGQSLHGGFRHCTCMLGQEKETWKMCLRQQWKAALSISVLSSHIWYWRVSMHGDTFWNNYNKDTYYFLCVFPVTVLSGLLYNIYLNHLVYPGTSLIIQSPKGLDYWKIVTLKL